MRNLRNVRHSHINFSQNALPLAAAAWDATSDSLICAFGPTEENPVIELKRLPQQAENEDDAKWIASWDAPSPNPELQTDKILSLQYFADTSTICLILAGGDLVVVREQPLPSEDLIEILGSVDAGITAAAWSPDGEVVAISTGAKTLILMTRDFDSIANVPLSAEDVNASAHVSVGWGKSETQFKGKRAKALRDPTVPEHIDEGTLTALDQGVDTITWRGDGAYLAINTIEQSKRRMIRVFSREGALDGVSEPVDGLEGTITWRPSGNLIAGIQRRSEDVQVVFFERNGLRHGQFSLRLNADDASSWATEISLQWNTDSTVLAAVFKDRVQLWTMSNYHYYLKQEILLKIDTPLPTIVWHPEKATQLAIVCKNELRSLHHVSSVSSGPSWPPNDTGLVAVIDGKTIKLSPLRLANVPPPMALAEISLPETAVDVAVSKSGTRIAVLHSRSVSLYGCDFTSKPRKEPLLLHTCDIDVGIVRQIAFEGNDTLAVLHGSPDCVNDSLTIFKAESLETSNSEPLDSSVIHIFSRSDHERICLETRDATVKQITLGVDSGPVFEQLCKLPAPCLRSEVWHSEDRILVFGLSPNGTLYGSDGAQECLRVRNVTSFLITPAHLIFTTTQHLLKFVHLHGGALNIPLDEPEKDERCRSIERGARLVTVMPSAYSLVLQMPRGNLETIYPRALVLAGIRKSIDFKDYKKAFLACRNHRVDMNILHDYAPAQFMSSVDLLVKQIKKVEHIDLFLSQLRDEDVAETMYKETLNVPSGILHKEGAQGTPVSTFANITQQSSSKVNRICDAFLDALRSHTSTNLQNIVTAHVCKSPPDLEAGLTLVSSLRESQREASDKAVEHICFLADVNRLYEAALGLYDLDVALLIAQNSQKDPREYLPYLQILQELPQLRRQFTIDHDLKRHTKALNHLFTLDAFSELKTYTVKHELFNDTIHLYRYQPSCLNELMRLYADFLSSRNRFRDAGIAYEYLSDYSAATSAYLAANMWQQCLSSASLASYPPTELHDLASSLADGLSEAKDYASAAAIQTDYLSDIDSAVRSLCKGHHYDTAMRLVALHKRPDLLTSALDPGLIDGSASTTELLAEMKSQLSAQVPRLRDLRETKRCDPLAFLGGGRSGPDGGEGHDFPDDISLAPSATSTSAGTFLTRYTGRNTNSTLGTNATRRTAKGKRREERKRARGKKGSVYEEEYLVNSVGRLIERVNSLGEEIERLVEGLMRRAMRERAVAVSNAAEEVREMCRGCIPEVFEVESQAQTAGGNGGADGEGEDGADGMMESRPPGGDGVLWDAMVEGQKKREAPVVKMFSKMSLLG